MARRRSITYAVLGKGGLTIAAYMEQVLCLNERLPNNRKMTDEMLRLMVVKEFENATVVSESPNGRSQVIDKLNTGSCWYVRHYRTLFNLGRLGPHNHRSYRYDSRGRVLTGRGHVSTKEQVDKMYRRKGNTPLENLGFIQPVEKLGTEPDGQSHNESLGVVSEGGMDVRDNGAMESPCEDQARPVRLLRLYCDESDDEEDSSRASDERQQSCDEGAQD